MKKFLFITIDTEEDNWGGYDPHRCSVDNIRQIPSLQAVFDRFDAVPTYLVNFPVAANPYAVNLLKTIREEGRCEIGTHLHPWNTPPFLEHITPRNTMLCNLPEDLIAAKLESLHERISEAFQLSPDCFRSGRWGFNGKVAKALIHAGYRIDSSVTPYVDWRADHGQDFSDALQGLYRIAPQNVLKPCPNGSLVEVPPTIGFFQKNSKIAFKLYRVLSRSTLSKFKVLGVLDQLHLLNFRWLCPELSNEQSMIRLARTFITTGYSYLNMSFHSTILLPGASPYVKDDQELGRILKKISHFIEFAQKAGFSVRPLSDALKLIDTKPEHTECQCFGNSDKQ